MSDSMVQGPVLSREELDALLRELARSRREEEDHRRVFTPSTPSRSEPYAPLRRALERFGAEYSKILSSAYQKRIEWSVSGWDEVPFAELAEICLPADRLVVFSVEPSEDLGYVLVSRPLLFEWLCLAYGGRSGLRANPVPERPYTRIEKRFLQRIVGETLDHMQEFLEEVLPISTRVVGVEEPRALLDANDNALWVSFDVQGLGQVGRVRMAFPQGPLARLQKPRKTAEPRQRPGVRSAVLEMPVPVRAEAGSVEISLRRLAELQEGDVLPLEGPEDGSLILRVGGAAKFRAVRGTVGRRLAVQVIDRIG